MSAPTCLNSNPTHDLSDKRFNEIYDRVSMITRGTRLTTEQGRKLLDLIKLSIRG